MTHMTKGSGAPHSLSQTYEGIEGATDESIWTVMRVDDHPEDGTFVQLHAVDPATGGLTWTADPDALAALPRFWSTRLVD